MACSCQVLSATPRGRIIHHRHDLSDEVYNLSLQFNNITQWLSCEDLYQLEWTVRSLDPACYFAQYPTEDRIHIRTPFPQLYFSFLPDEFSELKELLVAATTRLHWQGILDKSRN